ADRGRLSRAHLAGELHEAAGFVDPIEQVSESLGVALAQEEVSRIGRDRERLFVQAEERQVHARLICVRGLRGRSLWGASIAWERGWAHLVRESSACVP